MANIYSFLAKYLLPYFQRKLLIILFLGFLSGLPLLLSFGTLSAWLREAGVDRSTIGLFALVGLPYALKPIWAPLIDGLKLPFVTALLGRRRGWLIVSQVMLLFAIVNLAFSDPLNAPISMAVFAVLVAFFSASQDIVIDAYRIEILEEEQQGMGAAMVTYGYRAGMLMAGAGTLYLADYWSWTHAYLVMGLIIITGSLLVLFSPEPDEMESPTIHKLGLGGWIYQFVVRPFLDFSSRPGWVLILLFIVTFKLGDAFLSVMTNPFYIDLGFSKSEIAEVTKLFGVLALGVGLFVGGIMIQKFGLLASLIVTGVLQAVSNLASFLLSIKDNPKFSDCKRVKDKQIRPLPYLAMKFITSGEVNSPKTHKSPSFSLFSSSTSINILPSAASFITSSILDKPILTPRKIRLFLIS